MHVQCNPSKCHAFAEVRYWAHVLTCLGPGEEEEEEVEEEEEEEEEMAFACDRHPIKRYSITRIQ